MSTTTARLSTAEYHDLIDRGDALGPHDFLWDGEIIRQGPEKPPHISTLTHLLYLLLDSYPRADWTIMQNAPLELRDAHEPQPDLLVLRGPLLTYHHRLPRPADVELLVEVASTTLAFDVGTKLRGYAEAAIPHYWIADVQGRAILAFRDPDPATGTYREARTYVAGASVPLGAGAIAVNDVLGHLR